MLFFLVDKMMESDDVGLHSIPGVVLDVCSDIPAWAGREVEEGGSHGGSRSRRGYFGIRTVERVIEFECRSRHEQRKWVQGITEMLLRRDSINNVSATWKA